MTAQTIMATARHVKQVAAASRSLASPSANRSEGCKLFCKNFEIRAISKNAIGVGAASQPLILNGRTIWIADAHRDGKRFIVRADEMLNCVSGIENGDSRVRSRRNVVTDP